MNRIEQLFNDAAPPAPPPRFPLDVKRELDMIPFLADSAELVAGSRPARESRPRTSHQAIALLLVMLVTGALWTAATGRPSPPTPHGSEHVAIRPADSGSSAATSMDRGQPAALYSEWRTAVLSRPWTDTAAEVVARIELPAEWMVLRHSVSSAYPGLHVTVVDQDSLPVAMLYFGPVPSTAACRSEPGQQAELERIPTVTRAELMDSSLAKAFSFVVTAGQERRGSFALLALPPGDRPCPPDYHPPPVVLHFADTLDLPGTNGTEPPRRSSYARTFATSEDAQRYIKSTEYGALKRMLTSLRLSFPHDMSAPWRVPDGTVRELR